MKLVAMLVTALSLLTSGVASAQSGGAAAADADRTATVQGSQTIKITRSGSQQSSEGPAEHFTGSARIDPWASRGRLADDVQAENDKLRSLDCCPNCDLAFEIAAADLSIISGNILLYVCPGCGLTKAESRMEARRKMRARIAELSRLLIWLKLRTLKRERQ